MIDKRFAQKLVSFQDHMGAWLKYNFPYATSDHQLKSIMEELGELCHADLKQEQGIKGNENHELKIKDSVGDIFISLVNYCNVKGIDFDECLNIAYTEVISRDWQKNPETGKDKK